MPKSDRPKRQRLEELEALYAKAKAEQATGDPSLDFLLATLEPSFRHLVQSLAVPHWFDERVLAVVGGPDLGSSPSQVMDDIVEFSFVRAHPRGYAYHDLVREALLRQLVRQDPELIREVSRRLAGVFLGGGLNGDEDLVWERVYLTLGFDEEAGLNSFGQLFTQARKTRRFTVCHTLVDMASEHTPRFSPRARSQINYYRGLLAYDLRDFENAETIFSQVDAATLADPFARRVQLYLGLIFEAKGLPEKAERIYRACLRQLKQPQKFRDFLARLYHRLAEVNLAQGDLGEAEAYTRKSLRMNEDAKNLMGQALNLETLATVYKKLRDLPHAQKTLERSLALFGQAGLGFHQARIFVSLATLQEGFGRWTDAEGWYKKALEARAEARDEYGMAVVYANLGNLYLKQGNPDMALRHLGTSLRTFQRFRDHFRSAQVLHNMALADERLNDLDSAVEHINQAFAELPQGSRQRDSFKKELARLKRISQLRPR